MIKSILAVSEGGPDAAMAYRLARELGGMFGAGIEAVHYPSTIRGIAAGMVDGIGGSSIVVWEEGRLEARAETSSSAYAAELGQVSGASYVSAQNPDFDDLLARARTTDIMVVGRPGSDPDNDSPATVQVALYEASCPLLVAPPSPTLGGLERVAIAWNGSQQAARAVRLALPFLQAAKEVNVVVVGADQHPIGTKRLAGWVGGHGVTIRTASIDPGAVSARARGRAVLAFAHDSGANLLVMGAYGQGKVMEFLGLGGATAKVISSCRVPVLMAH